MAKTYLEGETKEQRKARKAREKLARSQPLPPLVNPPSTDKKYYVLCLKHGTKYDAEYVNKLYNGVKRNCTLDYEFVCLTEDSRGIDPNVKIIDLPPGLSGWWNKPYIYSAELPIKGTILYLDLDVIISNNIDKLFTYQPGRWCTIRDFTRAMKPNWPKYNSSVVRFETGQLDYLWTKFRKDAKEIQRKYFGDQDYLFAETRTDQAFLYPDSWTQSWKWEVRKNREFAPGGTRGNRKLKVIEDVVPRVECCVCVFHGDPNPHNCEDPWVKENWK